MIILRRRKRFEFKPIFPQPFAPRCKPSLTEDEVVGPEDLTEGAGPHGVHGAGLEVDQHGARHVLAAAGLVVVHVDALQLQVGVAMVRAGGVDAVLIGDDLPELPTEGPRVRSGRVGQRRGGGGTERQLPASVATEWLSARHQ